VFAESQPEARKNRLDARADLWDGDEAAMAQLAAAGFGDSAVRVVNAVALLRGARQIRVLTEASQQRLRLLLPLLFDEAAKLPEPAVAALRALDVITAIAGRSTYLSLLRESAIARGQLLRLCAASPWIAELLARTPALLDALLDPRLSREAPPREAYAAELRERITRLGSADIEPRMELLRRYRQEMTLRIAAADLAGALPLPQVSDRLTWPRRSSTRHCAMRAGSSATVTACRSAPTAARPRSRSSAMASSAAWSSATVRTWTSFSSTTPTPPMRRPSVARAASRRRTGFRGWRSASSTCWPPARRRVAPTKSIWS
jgi:glutamate-ammonia-ligase adenylyltransferase